MSRPCDIAAEKWKSCRAKSSGCRPDAIEGPPTLQSVVRAYRQRHRPRARAELDFYASLPSLGEAVLRAARAERPDGKRHDHQTRIRRSAIQEVQRRLARLNLSRARDFHDLHTRIDAAIGPVPGIGALTVYDTTLRIGAKLGLEPEFVYLHAGTRAGAKALGLRSTALYLRPSELPTELRTLRPHEVEDVLCIFKQQLRRSAG